jgi:ABC-type cobalamin/Fe3+-siderophores transport system ATPase subunit
MPRVAVTVKGNFSWGFFELKKKDEKGKKKKAEPAEEQEEVEKPLSDYLPLRDLDITIKKGEFVCIIGDVGSGKSSLFSAIIGDMIHVPQAEIEGFGDQPAKKEAFEKLNSKLLKEGYEFEPPISVDGSIAYVEQNAWI